MITYLTVSVAASLRVRIHPFKARDLQVELAHYRRVGNLTLRLLALIVAKLRIYGLEWNSAPFFLEPPGSSLQEEILRPLEAY